MKASVRSLRMGPVSPVADMPPPMKASVYSKAFWLAATLLPAEEQQRYHIVRAYRYDVAPDLDRLDVALLRLLERNANLRTRYFEKNGVLWQCVGAAGETILKRSVAYSPDEACEQIRVFTAEPFNLATKSPAAFRWIENTIDGGGTFVVKFHHIAQSGADLDAVISAIGELYDSNVACPARTNDTGEMTAWMQDEATLYADYQPGTWARRLRNLPEQNSVRMQGSVTETASSSHYAQQAQMFDIPEQLFASLVALTRQQHCSVFDACKVLWGMTLSRCVGHRRVLLTFPIDVRRKTNHSVKGVMINSLFYAHVNEGSFADALASSSIHALDTASVCLPSAAIESECGLDASAYHFSIAQSDLGMDAPVLAGGGDASYVPCVGASELLLICNGPRLVYQHTLGAQVSDDFLARLHDTFVNLLADVVADPSRDMSQCSVPEAASAFLGPDPGEATPLLDRIIAVARHQPAAVALVHNGVSVSYGQLVRAASACADDLIALAALSNSRNVGVMLPRGIELAVAMLGIWMAGMVFVPLDVAQPEERLATIANDACLCVLITEHVQSLLTGWSGPHIDASQASWLRTRKPLSRVTAPSNATELAYLIYTSGSTGTPKGVAQTHRTIDNLIRWEGEHMPLPGGANVTQLAAVGFDVSVEEMTFAFAHGHALHVVDEATKLSPARLVAFMRDHRICRAFLPTALLESFCRAAASEPVPLPDLVNITVAGEALKLSQHIDRFFQHYAHVSLFNEYGPTETHVVTANTLGATRQLDGMSIIGQPLSRTALYVLGEQGKPVCPGMVGELYVGGDGVASGYWGREEITAERFVSNPVSGDADRYPTLYRTGDLVRTLPDGSFQYVGRADRQVKINGHRIELAEIECALLQHPAVLQATVLLDGDAGRQRLTGFYIAGAPVDEGVLRDYLAARVPGYMVPSLFVPLDALPLNANGKVDKAALQASLPARVCDALPPTSGLQSVLCQQWSRQLGVPAVGVDEDFFDLGGDSLGALTMAAELSRMFGRDCTLADIYRWRTIEAIVSNLASTDLDRSTDLVVPLHQRGTQTALFLFHSGRGGAEVYHALAQEIDADVHGVDSYLTYRDTDVADLDALCDIYAEQVRAVAGSYERVFLGGWSFGGVLAYKVAQRLRNIEGLVLIDTATVQTFCRLDPIDNSAWIARIAPFEGARGERLRDRLLFAAQRHEALYRSAAPCTGLPRMPILYFQADEVDDEYGASARALRHDAQQWRRGQACLDVVDVASTHNRILVDALDVVTQAINTFVDASGAVEATPRHHAHR